MACTGEAPIAKGEAHAELQAQAGAAGSRQMWRARARLAATLGNSAMVCYVYAAHLLGIEWERFGARTLDSRSIRDYLWLWELDPAFEHLRLFTFSEAMLENLSIYMLVGTPVSVVLLVLERDRIRWLQSLLRQALPDAQASRAAWWLERYLLAFGTLLMLILALGPLHLERPRAHYLTAGCALNVGLFSNCLYLGTPIDLGALEESGNQEAAEWAARARNVVRPALKLVLALHALALGAAVWKAETLGDDHAALLFGVLETLLVLGYQLFAGIFVVDDALVEAAAWKAEKQKLKEATVTNTTKPAPALKTMAAEKTDGGALLTERLIGS